jgi:hypothetical protein
MAVALDMTGRFGQLTVVSYSRTVRYPGGGTQRYYLVRCTCGEQFELQGCHLRHGSAGRKPQRMCPRCGWRSSAESRAKLARRLSNGETVREASKRTGLSMAAINRRLALGWSLERAFSPMRPRQATITVGGVTLPTGEWLRRTGITAEAFRQRVLHGMSREEAATAPRASNGGRASRVA